MKKLALVCLLFLAAGICSAEAPMFPYVFTGTPMTCAPMSNCINTLYLPAGWYGSIYENGSIRCYQSLPWAQGYQLNLLVQMNEFCARTNTLMEAYLYTTSAWNYAPGNPWAQNNVIWAAALGATGVIYAIINNGSYSVGSAYEQEDCYSGNTTESTSKGGSC